MDGYGVDDSKRYGSMHMSAPDTLYPDRNISVETLSLFHPRIPYLDWPYVSLFTAYVLVLYTRSTYESPLSLPTLKR